MLGFEVVKQRRLDKFWDVGAIGEDLAQNTNPQVCKICNSHAAVG